MLSLAVDRPLTPRCLQRQSKYQVKHYPTTPYQGDAQIPTITRDSGAKSLGPERERMRRTASPGSISYLSTPNYLSPSNVPSNSPLFSPFLFCSSFCPSITPFLTISPDPILILILLPHGSITHFSHFCIYTKERGAPLPVLKPPKLSPPIPPKYRSPKPLPYIPSLIVYFIFNQMRMFLNLRGHILFGAMRL